MTDEKQQELVVSTEQAKPKQVDAATTIDNPVAKPPSSKLAWFALFLIP